ncbi:hypothetical protein [Thermomonas aquatica]|uniref:Uncharacterized protein n=1 Tax=Thermomonas aquatica TaxID=2202149 RepID=A0A5B7ZMX3_9GAMM|nr:hypothetical protein [Thermomonas aquatica]QDA56446.1 hypothetical protein FHQ07_03530 [Thermomonas aquatica]QDA56481.1 hypothetical protein FHQ07_03715 [Thermomonas aquatica]QDA56506.1 hypothetical protein FHQ07_03845 [Thermomonas aquatica]
MRIPTLILTLLVAASAAAAERDFSGQWTIDIRSPEAVKQNKDCGFASFDLKQVGDRITGTHTFATSGCGRINDSGPVTGILVSPKKAVLIVTSARNGDIAYGIAILLPDHDLDWKTIEYVRESGGDSPLILGKGRLHPGK